jgi:hypothetical protein
VIGGDVKKRKADRDKTQGSESPMVGQLKACGGLLERKLHVITTLGYSRSLFLFFIIYLFPF